MIDNKVKFAPINFFRGSFFSPPVSDDQERIYPPFKQLPDSTFLRGNRVILPYNDEIQVVSFLLLLFLANPPLSC